MNWIDAYGLKIASPLFDFVNSEAVPGTGVDPRDFWTGYAALLGALAPRCAELLTKRDTLQQQIDEWHVARRGQPFDQSEYMRFLREIGYLIDEPAHVSAGTKNVDPEIAVIAGPQLVVPVTNARYALNAANARWGSLYDALYGSDAIPETGGAGRTGGYNKIRGEKVVAKARAVLDSALPLATGSHAQAAEYACVDGALRVTLKDGTRTSLKGPEAFVGYKGDPLNPPPSC